MAASTTVSERERKNEGEGREAEGWSATKAGRKGRWAGRGDVPASLRLEGPQTITCARVSRKKKAQGGVSSVRKKKKKAERRPRRDETKTHLNASLRFVRGLLQDLSDIGTSLLSVQESVVLCVLGEFDGNWTGEVEVGCEMEGGGEEGDEMREGDPGEMI